MKKIILLLCMVLCSCRDLPIEYYTYSHPMKKDIFEYDIQGQGSLARQTRRALKDSRSPIAKVKISAEQNHSGAGESFLYSLPTVLSLGLINLIGWPGGREVEVATVEATVYDADGQKVNSYNSTESDWAMVAYYYGYTGQDAKALAYSRAYKTALDKVLTDIDNDDELYEILQASKTERNKRIKKLAAQKKEKMKSLLNEMEDM